MTTEHWAAANFVGGQRRIVIVDKFGLDAEPPARGAFMSNVISHNHFLQMIESAFPKDTSSVKIMAILNRSVVVVNSKK